MTEERPKSSSKPSFPIGWTLADGIRIKDFIERHSFTEIFELEDGRYLYVFNDPAIQAKLEQRQIEHERPVAGRRKLYAKRFDNHTVKDLADRIYAILNLRGFDAIAGMPELKALLKRDVIDPFKYRETYSRYKLNIPNGILFFGPPGCGKTYIARRVGEELNVPLIEVHESDIGSAYIHTTAANIAKVFKDASAKSPCVVFFDEISGFLPKRDGLTSTHQYKESEINEFLVHLEGAGNRGLLVIGATNYPDRIDTAILRSGRMDKRIFVPPPDYEARIELTKMALQDRPVAGDVVPEIIADMTEGLVASDIRLLVDNAARRALGERADIDMDHLRSEASVIRPSISRAELLEYSKFADLERK